jgi:type I restriction enzyme S subunit
MRHSKLEDLFDYLPKSKIKAGDGLEKGEYPFYTSSDIQSKYLDDFQHEPGCLVFGTGGKASVHLTTRRFATSTDCITIKPKASVEIDVGYVFQYFRGNMQVLENGFKGAGLKHISKAYLSDIKIPYPEDIREQQRIADLLGKVEALITQRKQHLQQLDDLLKSVFMEMFGDPVQNEKGWEKKTAIDFAECIVPGRDKPKSFSGGTPWVTTGDLMHLGYTEKSRTGIGLSEYEIKEVRARVVPKSSVLMTCVGDLGVVSICNSDMVINQQLHAFQVSDEMTAEFFMYSLSFQKKYMYQNASQTTLPYMNKTVCNKTPMVCPPTDLQMKFSELVQKVFHIKSKYHQILLDLEALYGALSQQAFKGELDLSRVVLGDV